MRSVWIAALVTLLLTSVVLMADQKVQGGLASSQQKGPMLGPNLDQQAGEMRSRRVRRQFWPSNSIYYPGYSGYSNYYQPYSYLSLWGK
ncbi:hypothetical protein AAVH_17679 [Aphelenchoides avenae]|nr:hypothetical protein AAVH_17679 [Aphelenchus avenae]